MLKKLLKDKVLVIAWVLALISMLFVHPDAQYAGYIDVRVLVLLFCLMTAVNGFKEAGVFRYLMTQLYRHAPDTRRLCGVLIMICFFSSMLITNDVALITFVPFGIMALKECGAKKLIIPTVVMQTIAANLGSMATPVGNPQNLYLFSAADMSAGTFFGAVLPYTFIAFVAISAYIFTLPRVPVAIPAVSPAPSDPGRKQKLVLYCALFLIDLLVVFRVTGWLPALIITAVALMITGNARLILKADFSLLITFTGFFIFVGNLGRIPAISSWLSGALKGRELLLSCLFSQFLSNVPCAILMSGFTTDLRALIIGTDIGGLGTLIASMASLISYKQYAAESDADTGRYMLTFTAYNIAGLALLLIAAVFIK